MKKNYFLALLLLFVSAIGFAQTINANDDVYTVNPGSGAFLASVRNNDVINGIVGGQPNCAGTIITLVSDINNNFNFSTGCGTISVPPGMPVGTYTFTYQVCLSNAPNVCDTATVTINVCGINAPLIAVLQGDCGSDMIPVNISNLPETGSWTITYIQSNVQHQVQGTGPDTILDLPPGNYTFSVTNAAGCGSSTVNYFVPYPQTLDGTLTPTFVDVNGNGQINVGDMILYEVNVINPMDCNINNLHPVGGNVTATGNIVLLPGNTENNTGITAYHTLTQQDINAGNFSGMLFLSGTYGNNDQAYTKIFSEFSLNISSGIRMIAFIDANADGIKNNGEVNYTGGQFTYQANNMVATTVYASSGEAVIYENNAANVYSLGYNVSNMFCADQVTVSGTGYTNVTVPAGSGITNYYFPVQTQSCTDLSVYISTSGPVPGMPYYNMVTVFNQGNTPASGTLTYTAPTGLTIASVGMTGTTPTSDGFTYNFGNLAPGGHIQIGVVVTVPSLPAVALGDFLTSTATVTMTGGTDNNTQNNTFTLNRQIQGSYDPNDKSEAHGGEIPYNTWTDASYLTYTIRFENTGNGNANFIRIQDMLESTLDPSTLHMVAASHPYVLERQGSNLEWKFNNIQLPPSQPNSLTGKGFVTFQIKPYAGFAPGMVVNNTAAIFFDTNPAIITNTVATEFTDVMGTPDINGNNVTLYPNPVHNVINIRTASGLAALVQIADVTGKTVMVTNTPQNGIDISSLANGLYFVKVQLPTGGEQTIKVMKQ